MPPPPVRPPGTPPGNPPAPVGPPANPPAWPPGRPPGNPPARPPAWPFVKPGGPPFVAPVPPPGNPPALPGRPNPPPPGPNPRPAPAGPAVGSAPACGVRTVETAYAVGAASPMTRPAVRTAAAARRRGKTSAIDTTMPTPRRKGRSDGAQSGVRESSVFAHSVVAS